MTSPATPQYKRPLPTPNELSKPFWDATKQGRLVMQRCTTCHEYVWTPQMACRNCLTETLQWEPISGRGEVYSFVVMHRAANPAYTAPYAILVVKTEEGPLILSDLVGMDPTKVQIGMPVEVQFEDGGPIGFYHFRPRK